MKVKNCDMAAALCALALFAAGNAPAQTTTVRPVYVTEVKMGTVVGQSGRSIIVKQDTGKIHRFSQSEVDARGVQLFMDDKPVRVFNLNVGDQITAKIVTAGEPEELTAQQVAAVLANEPPVAAPAAAPGDASADAATDAALAEEPMAGMAPAAEESAAEEGSKLWMWALLIVILALIIWVVARNRDKNKKKSQMPCRPGRDREVPQAARSSTMRGMMSIDIRWSLPA